MSTVQIVSWIALGVLTVGSSVSFGQSQYYDGDADAFVRKGFGLWALFHQPQHPWAVRAKRRGWLLGAAALVPLAVLFATR